MPLAAECDRRAAHKRSPCPVAGGSERRSDAGYSWRRHRPRWARKPAPQRPETARNADFGMAQRHVARLLTASLRRKPEPPG